MSSLLALVERAEGANVLLVEEHLARSARRQGEPAGRAAGCRRSALTGACGCGAVRFEVTAPFVAALYCHCTRCQRRTRYGEVGQRAPRARKRSRPGRRG